MQKKYLIFLYIVILALSNAVLEAREHHMLGNKTQTKTQTKNVIYHDNGRAADCINNMLFTIDLKEIPILDIINGLSEECNMLVQINKNAKKLIGTTPNVINFENEKLSVALNLLLKPYGMTYEFDKNMLIISAAKQTTADSNHIALPTPPKVDCKAPEIYSSLGEELALFKQSCDKYQDLPLIDDNIKKQCEKYNKKVIKSFKIGYKLDKNGYKKKDIEHQKEKFLNIMRSADDDREALIGMVAFKIKKARDDDNIDQYIQLIQGKHYSLTRKDYEFMDKYPEKMKSDPRYIRYAELKLAEKRREEAIALEKKRKAEAKKAKEIAKRKEKNRELVRKAQEDLERQIKQSKADKLYAKAESLSHETANNQKVISLYKQACDLGHAHACYMVGLVSAVNAKEVNNPENKYFQKACKLNDAEACGRIAMLYTESDFEKCKFYQKKACDLGSSESCVFLANIYKEGFHVKKSDAEYKMYQNKAEAAILSKCRKGDGTECKRLGDIYNPEGVVRNHKSDAAYAIKMYQAGCELNDTHACAALADIYYGGKYTKVDDREVLKLYEKACKNIPPFAPMSYVGIRAGKIAYVLKDYTKAAKYFEKYCTPSSLDPECSFILGNIYLKGEGVEPNINKAKKFLKQSCDTANRIQDKITEDVRYGCRAYDKLIKHSDSETTTIPISNKKVKVEVSSIQTYRYGNNSKSYTCERVAYGAKTAMKLRQENPSYSMSLVSRMPASLSVELDDWLLSNAYKYKRYSTKEEQNESIRIFRDSLYQECLQDDSKFRQHVESK